MVENEDNQTIDVNSAEIVLGEELRAKEDFERQEIISSLNKDPWNTELLERFYRLNVAEYARVILRDLIISNPTGEFGIREGVRSRFRRYQSGSISSLESLTLSFSGMFSDIQGELNGEVIGYVSTEIENCYRINPLSSKDLAVSVIRAIAPISEDLAIEFFRTIKYSLIDSRTKRTAYNVSKRTGRFLLSLSLVESLENPDIVENERWVILNSIADSLFGDNAVQLQQMLEDQYPDIGFQAGLEKLILNLSNFSEIFKDFSFGITKNKPGRPENLDLYQKLIGLKKFHEDECLCNYEIPEFGDPIQDMKKIPFFSILKRRTCLK